MTKQFQFIPKLYLAPMEGVADRPFRLSCARFYPHFDEATTEFIRLPRGGHIPSLIAGYNPNELSPIPLAAQVMTHCVTGAAEIVSALEEKGAKRVELNCGCPSNTVTGRGAGSALLEDPEHLREILAAMRKACQTRLSVKMRLGYRDSALFERNLAVIEQSGVDQLTIHPRTKEQGYRLPCHWDFLSLAKKRLSIPIIGSGEIKSAGDADRMSALIEDFEGAPFEKMGLMIGRAALGKPWIFTKIKIHFLQKALKEERQETLLDEIASYQSFLSIDRALLWLEALYSRWRENLPHTKQRVRRLKQQINSLFDSRLYEHCSGEQITWIDDRRRELLRSQAEEKELYELLKVRWEELLRVTSELEQ